MKKLVGYVVAFLPFIAAIVWLFWMDWKNMLLVLCGIVLFVDILFWFIWFFVVGMTIVEREN